MPTNTRPHIELLGIDDRSAAQVTIEPEQLPQHLPVVFLLTELSEQISIAGDKFLAEKYGLKTLDETSDFFNHQSVIASLMLSQSNQVMVVPIKLPDSRRASLRISVEIIPMTEVTSGIKKHKNRIIWHAEQVPEGEFAQGDVNPAYRAGTTVSELTSEKLGILVDTDDKEYSIPSIKLPIFDIQPPGRGSHGSRLGIILDAPFITDTQPTDQTLAERLGAFIYRMNLVERAQNSVTHSVLSNQFGSTSSDFVLRPNSTDNRTGNEIGFGDVIVNNYSSTQLTAANAVVSPFNQPAIYQDNIETVSYLLAAGHEVTAKAVDGVSPDKTFSIAGVYDNEEVALQKMHSVNILTGRNYQGKVYDNVHMAGSYLFGGVEFGKESVIYAKGGTDGFPKNAAGLTDKLETLRIFDEEVRRWCREFDDTKPIFDSAVYPFSTLYDSGFSFETKLALLQPMSKHKRIYTILGTQSCAEYLTDDVEGENAKFGWCAANDIEKEIAIATRLNTAAHLYPESELFGTSVCRAVIVPHCGYLRSGMYRGLLPLTHTLAYKLAGYCGAGNGFWKREKAIDTENGRVDELFKDVNNTYQSPTNYDRSWRAGMTWVQNFDRRSVYFPTYQTVFKDSSSILDSLLTIVAASYVQRVGEIVYRKMGNNNSLGKTKFLEQSNNEIIKLTKNKFDGRFDIVPVSQYTSTDETFGNRWSTVVELYGDVPNILDKFSIETYRRPSNN